MKYFISSLYILIVDALIVFNGYQFCSWVVGKIDNEIFFIFNLVFIGVAILHSLIMIDVLINKDISKEKH